MKVNKILTGLVLTSVVAGTAMASENNQNFNVGHYRSTTEADNSILYGTDINVTQHNDGKVVRNILIGGYNNMAQHDAHNSLTVGTSNNNNSTNSIVGGFHNTITNAENSIAGGVQNASHSANTLVFGNTNAIDFHSENSFAGGEKVEVHGKNSFAFGEKAHAYGNNAIAIGKNVEALGDDSINIGANNTVQDSLSNGVIIGTNNTVNKYYSGELNGKNIVAIGNGNLFENSSESIAIGGSTIQGADRSVGIGANSKVAAPNSVALGYDTFAYDVESTESAVINNKTYNFAGGKAHGTVGIGARGENGERTITGLAAGRINAESTDAVNGSQLHSVIEETNKIGAKVNIHETRINDISAKVDSNKEVLGNHEVRITELESKIDVIGPNAIKEANNYTDSQVAHVGAQSAALAGLHPLDFNKDDKASYAASVGHYRNANAVAVGAFYRPNERTMISGAVSFGKHIQMNLGVAFKTGKGSEYINEAKSKDSRIEKLEAMVEQLTAEVAELKANK